MQSEVAKFELCNLWSHSVKRTALETCGLQREFACRCKVEWNLIEFIIFHSIYSDSETGEAQADLQGSYM